MAVADRLGRVTGPNNVERLSGIVLLPVEM